MMEHVFIIIALAVCFWLGWSSAHARFHGRLARMFDSLAQVASTRPVTQDDWMDAYRNHLSLTWWQ